MIPVRLVDQRLIVRENVPTLTKLILTTDTQTRTKEQQQVIEDLTMKNNAVHNGCREALLKLNSLQVSNSQTPL